VFIGNGVSELIDLTLRALLNDGDEVLVPSPDYPLWTASVNLNRGGGALPLPAGERLRAGSGGHRSADHAAHAGDRRHQPEQPDRRGLSAAVLERIAQLAEKRNLVVFSDEIYDQMTYDGCAIRADGDTRARHALRDDVRPVEGLPRLRLPRRLGRVSGKLRGAQDFCRRWSCSPRCACAATCRAVGGADRARRLPEHQGTGHAGRAAVRIAPGDHRVDRRQPVPEPARAAGAMYAFVGVDSGRSRSSTTRQFALDLLEQKHVLVAPGVSFNVTPYRNHFRITNLPRGCSAHPRLSGRGRRTGAGSRSGRGSGSMSRPAAAIAVIVPELGQRAAAVQRSFLHILAPGWQLHPPTVPPLSLSGGPVLADYPVVFAALRLLQASSTVPDFALASQILRSVYSASATAEQAGRAELELWLRNVPAGHIDGEQLSARAQRLAPRFASGFATATDLLGEQGRRLLPGEWSVLFTRALDAHGWPGERGLDSEEFQAAAAWQALLQTFAGCDEVMGKVSLPAALASIESMARERPFVPAANPQGLQLLSLEEAAGQRFDHLWVCGMTADRWPPAPHPHALLPLQLQRAAGIPAAAPATLQAWTERRFARLLAAADEVVLSWAHQRDDAELLMSPLLDACGADTAGLAAALASGPDRESVARSAQPETVRLDPPPVWPAGRQLRGGARMLSLQAVCPARAFIEGRLHGKELRRPTQPLDPAMRGNLLHKLLERLYRHEECRRGLCAVPADRLSELYGGLIDKRAR
jgi:hypothetical protein